MLATKVDRRILTILTLSAGLLLAGCKGHSSNASIPQSLTNWIWESGSNAANSTGYYIDQGTFTITGQPAGRYGAMNWQDATGKLWIFGGSGAPNDIWEYNPSTLEWAWIGGNSISTLPQSWTGVYPSAPGTGGTAYLPGQRASATSWTDSSTGQFWLFGGYGTDTNGVIGYLNDIWSFDPTTKIWTWQGGSNQASGLAGAGVWGTMGTAAAGNQPNPRSNAAYWTGTDGNFYMFGGLGYLSGGTYAQNDMWKYSPSTQMWTWIGGVAGTDLANVVAKGIYGTQGSAASGNIPGSRQSASTVTDSTGHLWLFGGTGVDAAGNQGQLGDLWMYNLSTGLWTFVSGSTTVNNIGVYGSNATPSTSNSPGARSGATTWIDSGGNLWLYGGYGINSTGSLVFLNDLWQYQPGQKTWTWFNGSYNGNATGYYGTLGVASAYNMPGSRYYASAWTDSSGNFWLYGGVGYDGGGSNGRLGDLWRFSP